MTHSIHPTGSALAVALLSLLTACGGKDYGVRYVTDTVRRGDVTTSVTATGTIEPVTKVEVGTQVSGIIDHIYVDFNSVVRKGQVIAELDKTNLISRLASARSQLASAQSDLDYQTKNYQRMKELHDQQFISDDELETAQLALTKAQNTCAAQRLSVNEAQTNLSYATIYSPIDGVILSREVEEGQTVAAAMSTPTLFLIAQDLTDMRVIADVDEADIGGVAEGQRVAFTVDAYPGDSFEGRVTQVRQQATTTSNVVTYEVVISAPNPDLKLKPGLTASVTIYTMERQGVLVVPSKALRYAPRPSLLGPGDEVADCEARVRLWAREGNVLRAYPVETGVTNGTLTEVTGGVDEGFECVVEAKPTGADASAEGQPGGGNPFMPGRRGGSRK